MPVVSHQPLPTETAPAAGTMPVWVRRTADTAQAVAVLVLLVAVAGWVMDRPVLRSFIDGWPLLHPAVAAFLIGVALTRQMRLQGERGRGVGLILSFVLIVLQVAALIGWFFASDVLRHWLAPFSVLTLLLLQGAVVAGYWSHAYAPHVQRVLAASSAVCVGSGLLGVTFRLMLEQPALVEISLPGTLAVMLLAYAVVMSTDDAWFVDALTAQRAGAVLIRSALPVVLLFPLVAGLFRIAMHKAGAFDVAGGALFLTLATMVGFTLFALWLARVLDHIDSERERAEAHARAQREWLRVTLGSIDDAVIATDAQCRVQVANPATAKLLGRATQTMIGEALDRALELRDAEGEAVELPLRTLFAQGGHGDSRELNLVRERGEPVPVEVSVARIDHADGRLLGGVMVVRDVSERQKHMHTLRKAYAELDRRVADRTSALQQANVALHETLALFRGVAESTPDLIIVKDLEGHIVMANPACCKAFGASEAQLIGRSVEHLLSDPEMAQRVAEHDRRVLASGEVERVEQILQTSEGLHTFLSTKSPLSDVNGKIIGLISVETDITERKRIETELREAQRFTQGLLETAPLVLYLLDLEQGRIVFASGMVLEALGYDTEALRDMGREKLMELIHPDDHETLRAHIDSYEAQGDAPRSFEVRFCHKNNEWRWLHCRERLFDPQSSTPLVLGVAIDVTDRREAELELEHLILAEKRLRQDAERANRAKDEFLAVVSHELRSPLNALRGWSFLMGNAKTVDASLMERAVHAIKRNVDHQARLIDDLLDTSRIMNGKLTLERRPVNLVETVHAAMEIIRPGAEAKRVVLRFDSSPGSLVIEGDAARMHQVAINLLSNAVKFTPDEGSIDVNLSLVDGYVRLTVRDSGAGIAPDFLPRVFERFSQADSSTTRKHGGLGIGLALVRHLVELHGGRVSAESEGLGKGAIFRVDLPVPLDMKPTPPPEPQTETEEPTLQGLLVCSLDDDPDARDIIAVALRRAGADVRSAATGAELIAILDEQLPQSPPDVLLLDLAMPGEDGFTVLANVRQLEARKGMGESQRMPAVAVTAFAELSRGRIVEAGFVEHVAKPFDPGALVATVRRVAGAAKARTATA